MSAVCGRRRGPRRAAAVVSLAVAMLLAGWTVPAAAHTELISSDPAQDQVLTRAPTEVTLTFSEALRAPAYVVVTGPDGETIADGEGVVDGVVLSQSMQGAGRGTYRVSYRVVSEDGHAVTGDVAFAVGRPVRVPRTIRRRGGSLIGWTIVGGLAVVALVVAARRRPR